jgi:hypothetical protein
MKHGGSFHRFLVMFTRSGTHEVHRFFSWIFWLKVGTLQLLRSQDGALGPRGPLAEEIFVAKKIYGLW